MRWEWQAVQAGKYWLVAEKLERICDTRKNVFDIENQIKSSWGMLCKFRKSLLLDPAVLLQL